MRRQYGTGSVEKEGRMTNRPCTCTATDTYRQLDRACQVHGEEAERRRRMRTGDSIGARTVPKRY